MGQLSPEVRSILDSMIRQYATGKGGEGTDEGSTEEEIVQLVANAISAVEKFDREKNIGDRKLRSRKTVNDRLAEFFEHAGRHGVSLTFAELLTLTFVHPFSGRCVSSTMS